MDLLQMRYVTAIARIGNMTRAAETLHVSQSALSLCCKRLEGELGIQLFVREGRHLRLTPDGELFCEKASEILRLADDLEKQLRQSGRTRGEAVAFGSEVIDFSNEMITLHRQFEPDMEILADNATKHGVMEKLRSGEYGFALTLNDLTGEDMESSLLVDEPMLVLVGPTSDLNRHKHLEMRHLAGSPLVTTSEEYSIGELMRSFFTRADVKMGKIQPVGDSDSIVVKVYNNFGISFVPETVVNLWIRSPQICIPGIRWIPIQDSFCRRKIYLTRLRSHKPDAACSMLLGFLEGYSAAVRAEHAYPTRDEVLSYL